MNCNICYEQISYHVKLRCGHAGSCKDCLVEHCMIRLRDDRSTKNLTCLECKYLIKLDEIESFGTLALRQLYQDISFREWDTDQKDYKKCPTEGCPDGFYSTSKQLHTCLTCHTNYCSACLRVHDDYDPFSLCPEVPVIIDDPIAMVVGAVWNFGSSDQDRKTRRKNLLQDAKRTKLCPGCNTVLTKIGGCNHMTCSRCGHQCCWICLKDWIQGEHSYSCMRLERVRLIDVTGRIRFNLKWFFELVMFMFFKNIFGR